MSVVLPAPFGPTTACSLPEFEPMATPLTAARPPKRRVRPAWPDPRSMALRIRAASAQASSASPISVRRNRPATLASPPGRKITSRMIAAAEQKLPVVRQRLEDLRQRDERERADDGAVEAADAAQDQHQQHVARLMPRQELGIDEPELERRQIAGEAGERAGQREARELVAVDRKAQRAHPVLVAADALERAAERRAQHDAQEHEHGDQQDEHEVVDVRSRCRDRTA